MGGYKTFGTEVLTADDMNDLIMGQVVARVADATALDAIPAPGVGQLARRADTGRLYEWNGAVWDSSVPSLSGTFGPRDEVYYTARDRADGALETPLVTNSGTPFTSTYVGGAGFVISNEELTAAAGLPYISFGPLAGKVQEFKITVKWTDDSLATDAPAVMIVCDGPFHEVNNSSVHSNAGGHVLINRDRVSIQKRQADGLGTSGTYWNTYFPKPLDYGVWYTFTMRWDGKQVIFILPDGTSYEAGEDAEVQAWWANYACVELVANVPTANPVTISEFHVSSQIEPESNDPARREGRLLYRHETNAATSVTTPITSGTPCFSTPAEVVVPASKRILVEGAAWIAEVGPLAQVLGTLYLNVYYAGSSWGFNQTVLSGYTPISDGVNARSHGHYVPFSGEIDLSAFPVGMQYAITVRAYANTAGLFEFTDSGGGSGSGGLRRSWLNVHEVTI